MLRVFRGIENVEPGLSPSAVCVGNFDGVHAGHRRILQLAVTRSRELNLKPSVLTFDPHPTKIVAPQRAPLLLNSTEEKIELLGKAGIEQIFIVTFDIKFAALTPEEFVRDVLVEALRAKLVLVGDNFHYGAKQAGNVETLREAGRRLGFETEIIPGVFLRNRIASSSEVRTLLRYGNVSEACRFLERPYSIQGEIVSGHGIGSKQTVPTLNLSTEAELLPAHGVYISRTHDLENGRAWPSITNVGVRPTFDGDAVTIETFLLSPLEGLSPGRIRLEFLRRVREERKFDSPEALKKQILSDVSLANRYFQRVAKWLRQPSYTGL